MATGSNFLRLKIALGLAMQMAVVAGLPSPLAAQTAAPATPAARQLGTVKSITGNTITLATDVGQQVTVTVPPETKVVQLPAGSTDIKTAKPSQLSDIAVGDRMLATGKAGDTASDLTATRVVLMKSGDIAEKNAAEQADWRTRGTGGIVSAIDPASGTITLTAGTKKVAVSTSGKTAFKRFAGDSVKFQDAKPGTLAQIHTGDQLQARGEKSADGASVQAEEVVSGSFQNLSGVIQTLDAAAGKITLKDLATKKMMTVTVTANSDVRKMPLQMATAFAARTNGAAQGGGGRSGAGNAGGQAAGAAPAAGGDGAGRAYAAGGQGGPAGAGGGVRRAGADLSQMISRLPTSTLAELNKGDAVMIVASENSPGATTATAVTLLSGVEPILTANPNGGMDLSGWSMGGGPSGSEN